MDAQQVRQQRGLVIAATMKIEQRTGFWFVPSQDPKRKTRYIVRPDAEKPFCSCPDHEERQQKCKHIFAVEFVQQREFSFDGNQTIETVTETVSVTQATVKRPTYPQKWAEYNAAQVNERGHFLSLLSELCRTIPEPERAESLRGRKPIALRDKVFSAVLKVYSMMSARRFAGDLQDALDKGYIGRMPHFNIVLAVFDDPDVTPILKSMIETSAAPLKQVETTFAVDSSGFATSRFTKWFDEKYGKIKQEADWVKAHVCVGTTTNVITAVEILEERSGDSPQFPGLVHTTARTFKIGEMSADKAYAGVENFHAVEMHGGKFYPAFKSNTTGEVGGAFAKAFHAFCLNRDEYLGHYHQRSNVESTFSMVKRKFGDSVRAKTDTAMRNEVLAKFVCHNVCVLIAEMYALGIETVFTAKVTCTTIQKSALKLASVSGQTA